MMRKAGELKNAELPNQWGIINYFGKPDLGKT